MIPQVVYCRLNKITVNNRYPLALMGTQSKLPLANCLIIYFNRLQSGSGPWPIRDWVHAEDVGGPM